MGKVLSFRRRLLMASVSAGLVSGMVFASPAAAAPEEETNVQNLPPVEVAAPPPSAARRTASTRPVARIGAPSSAAPKTRLYVYPTAPGTGRGLDVDKVASAINAVDVSQIKRTGSLNITDALRDNIAGVNISEVTGNPFQPDVEFRGFVASPVVGTPQGLAVYQNGVRINEAFSDAVNWDLIPTAAIRSVTLVTNNPAFGLNALGGALNLQMKDGFTYQGAEIDVMGGSFGRIQGSAQWGKTVDKNFGVYGALEGLRDNGFRNFSQSTVRRFYGDVGYKAGDSEFHANMGVAKNDFGASATVPAELLDKYWGATYTTPQTTSNRVGYLNLTGKADATPTWTLEGTAHVRRYEQKIVDGNPTDAQECAIDPALLCFGDDTTPANGAGGAQLANPFAPGTILGEIDRGSIRSTSFGVSGQATNTDQLFGHDNRFVMGTSYDASVTRYNATAEIGSMGENYVVSGSGVFLGPTPVADPVAGPVSLRTVNQYNGLYAMDTFNVTDAFAITGGGRFNVARISLEDQLGSALNGDHTFTRFNPVIGGTYKITSELTAYAGYSEANRVPTPLETRLRRSHPALSHRGVPGRGPTFEAGRVQDRGGRTSWHQGAEYRHPRLEDRRLPRHQLRRHRRCPRGRPNRLRLFHQCRPDPPAGPRGGGQHQIADAPVPGELFLRQRALSRPARASARKARLPIRPPIPSTSHPETSSPPSPATGSRSASTTP